MLEIPFVPVFGGSHALDLFWPQCAWIAEAYKAQWRSEWTLRMDPQGL